VYLDSRAAKLEEPGWRETPWRLLSESAKLPAQFLSVPQLASYLKTNREFPEFRLASYRTWWHDRLARPLRCLIVVLFAAPLGIVFSRRGLMGSVASTILLYFGMYFLTLAFIRLGETAKMPAMAAAWSVNILFGAVGLAVLWQRTTNHDLRRSWKRLFSREAA
jgi:lipopolysaccharide export system permease protein